MRLLVIGGTRFIGPHVVHQLVARDHAVTVLHRGQTETELPATVRHIHSAGATMSALSIPPAALTPEPDAVIHMIPMGERDAMAAMGAFRGHAGRLVAVSSGDVYKAYGRFIGLEHDPVENGLLSESSPLRTVLYPYRQQAASPDDWKYSYEKILMEQVVLADPALPGVVLRLPKVYGPQDNADLATVYQARHHPHWRWTHGYVEDVAHAIVLAALHPSATGIFNVGEERTPTVAERLADLPPSSLPESTMPANYEQDIAYDTSRIRRDLGYAELVGYAEGIRRTLAASSR